MKIKPKRRKTRNNPYSLVNFSDKNCYIINFTDINKNVRNVSVSKEIYDEFNKFELEDLSEMNEYDRHIEHSKLKELTLNKRILNKNKSVEKYVIEKIENQELYSAILKLSKIQRNRILMYYFQELTQKEIAEKDNCSIRAVQYSINSALKKLKKFLK